MMTQSHCHRLTGHETQELTGSEIVSFVIDPVLSFHLLTIDNLLSSLANGTLGISDNCHVSYAASYTVNSYLVKLVLSASHPSLTDPGPPVTPSPIGTGGGA